MKFTLPPLPYKFDALEPWIDAKTMEIHHGKHHQAYTDKLNAALEKHPEIERPIEDMLKNLDSLPEDIRTAVRNHGGGYYNHGLFWTYLSPNSEPSPKNELLAAIDHTFSNFEMFQTKFTEAALNHFGSGWAWLVQDQSDIKIVTTSNQDSPLSQGLEPILGIDVWEHAYYLKYQNRRVEYLAAFWHIVNWTQIEKNFKK